MEKLNKNDRVALADWLRELGLDGPGTLATRHEALELSNEVLAKLAKDLDPRPPEGLLESLGIDEEETIG